MINEILTWINNSLLSNIYLSFFAAFIWGGLSILLSPCHLASIPLLVGYINTSGTINVKRSFYISILFALGILISIAAIGFVTAVAGRILGDIGDAGNFLIIIVLILFGLYFLNVLKLDWMQIKTAYSGKRNNLYSIVFGVIMGISLGPCTFAFLAPILSIVFGISAANISKGIMLLLAFALGHCLLIVLIGMLSTKIQIYLNWTQNSKAVTYIRGGCGAAMILFAVYFFYNTYF